jgi:replication factor C subunit 2/4
MKFILNNLKVCLLYSLGLMSKNDEDLEDEIEEEEESEKIEESETKQVDESEEKGEKRIIIKREKQSLRLNDSDFSSEDDDIKPIKKKKVNPNKIDNTMNVPWIEKYRPVRVDDLVLDDSSLNKIKKIIKDKSMPNIIITGIPGVGKTTTILCIAKNLLGKHLGEGVLELNASDERGVKTVQEPIEYFCKKKILFGEEYAQHKIVLLDEADNMTTKAQQSIKNLMKKYHETTRFAFTCNNASDIIEAIQSRCIIFKYSRLTNAQISKRLKKICEIEKVPYSEEGLMAIITTSQGDLRKAINNLQLTYNGYTNIIPANVYKLCDKPHPLIIQNIFLECKKKNIQKALEYFNSLRNGYSSYDISLSMISTLRDMDPKLIDEKTRIKYLEEVSKTCMVINKGINSHLQITGCLCALYNINEN